MYLQVVWWQYLVSTFSARTWTVAQLSWLLVAMMLSRQVWVLPPRYCHPATAGNVMLCSGNVLLEMASICSS